MAAGHPAGYDTPRALKYPGGNSRCWAGQLVEWRSRGRLYLVGQGKELVDLPHGVRG